jgi:hypothetical protein
MEPYSTVAGSERITEHRDYALEQFKGVDADQDRAIAPPPGWKIDLNSLGNSQSDGDMSAKYVLRVTLTAILVTRSIATSLLTLPGNLAPEY